MVKHLIHSSLLLLAVALVGPTLGLSPTAQAGPDVIRHCPRGQPHFEAARRELTRIDEEIKSLAAHDDPVPLIKALKALLDGPCFALASSWPGGLEEPPDTGRSLQHFWESGGNVWFPQFLRFDEDTPYTFTRPSVRKSLGSDTHPEHALAPLLCPLGDLDCAPQSKGWKLRAEHTFSLRAQGDSGTRIFDADPCYQEAIKKPEVERWDSWFNCLQREVKEAAMEQRALPLAQLRVDSGWWVLSGRRGHHQFCDEVRAYDLVTGTAYIVSSCSGLALNLDGSVDVARTEAQRKPQTRIGHLPLNALREAAWMSMLAPEVQEGVMLYGVGTTLPAEIIPMRASRGSVRGYSWGAGGGFHSGQTTLSWTWTDGRQKHITGELTWPEDLRRAGYEHAVKLLQIAEAGFVESCPKARPPRSLNINLKTAKSNNLLRLIQSRHPDVLSQPLLDSLGDLFATELCPR